MNCVDGNNNKALKGRYRLGDIPAIYGRIILK
jgi:hypothetical protein